LRAGFRISLAALAFEFSLSARGISAKTRHVFRQPHLDRRANFALAFLVAISDQLAETAPSSPPQEADRPFLLAARRSFISEGGAARALLAKLFEIPCALSQSKHRASHSASAANFIVAGNVRGTPATATWLFLILCRAVSLALLRLDLLQFRRLPRHPLRAFPQRRAVPSHHIFSCTSRITSAT